MRDFRDAKAMARSLRDALKAKAIETTHTEALELIAKARAAAQARNSPAEVVTWGVVAAVRHIFDHTAA
jgi:cobalamin biosynthesis protein CbiG